MESMSEGPVAGSEEGRDGRRSHEATRAAMLVQQLLGSVRRGAPVGPAVAHWLRGEQDLALRGAVTVQLTTGLTAALTAAWRRGWQPADVVHAARRWLSPRQVEALGHGVREELGSYARTTVDPRWWQQLEGLDDAAPGEDRGRRRARSRHGGPTGWAERCGDLAAATVFVERLPQLQTLGPLPGEARPDGSGTEPDVDDKLLTKVRRLLAQAEGTPYEAEAETFTAAAQSLMARHRIDRAMLEASDEQGRARRGPGAVRLAVDRPYEQPKMLLLSVVASANRCRALWNQSFGFATVVGHAADRRAVELLFTSLLVQATTAMQREGERHDVASRTRGFRSSFLSGFAARIGQRLEEASHCAEDEVRARLEGSSGVHPAGGPPPATGRAGDRMALVLRRRDEEVEQLVRELFPHTVRTRSRSVSDHAGWMQGRAAADRADLGVGGRLTGGGR